LNPKPSKDQSEAAITAGRHTPRAFVFASSSRATQMVLALAVIACLLVLRRFFDAASVLHVHEIPAQVFALAAFVCAAFTTHVLSRRLNAGQTGFDPAPMIEQLRQKFVSLSLQACVFADSFVCHKTAIAMPNGLIAGHMHSVLMTLRCWTQGVRLPRVIKAIDAVLSTLIDARTLRALIAAVNQWMVWPMLLAQLRQTQRLAWIRTAGAAIEIQRSPLNLRC
jgi:hypothetical protein